MRMRKSVSTLTFLYYHGGYTAIPATAFCRRLLASTRHRVTLGIIILMSLALPCEPETNTLPGDLAAPKPALATLPPFFTRAFFAEPAASSTPGSLRKDDFEIALLRRDPSLDEAGRVFGQVLVKLAFRVGLVEFLHEEGEVVVGADDGLEVCEVGF